MGNSVGDRPRQRQWPFVAFGLVFLGFVTFMASGLLHEVALQSRAHASFRPVTATIESASVREFRMAKRGTLSPITVYHPDFAYRYRVGEADYRSVIFAFRDPDRSAQAAQALVDAHPPGTRTIAFYDPSGPSRAVIDNRAPSLTNPIVTICLALLAGLAVVAFGLRGTRPRSLTPNGPE